MPALAGLLLLLLHRLLSEPQVGLDFHLLIFPVQLSLFFVLSPHSSPRFLTGPSHAHAVDRPVPSTAPRLVSPPAPFLHFCFFLSPLRAGTGAAERSWRRRSSRCRLPEDA